RRRASHSQRRVRSPRSSTEPPRLERCRAGMRRPLVASVVLVAVLVLAQASLAVGPVLPALMGASIGNAGSDVTYLVRHPAGGHTVVVERAHGHALRTTTIAGNYGLQMVAISGALAGLSPNGKVL